MRLKTFLSLAFALAVTGLAQAQDPNYILSASDASGPMGGDVTVTVNLDSTTGEEVQGWSYGACTDMTHATVVSVADGATSLGFFGGDGADFHETNLFPNGWTVGLVISFVGLETLPPGSGYESDVATLNLIGGVGSTSSIDLCNEMLGEPPVATVVVVGGASIPPTTASGTITVIDVDQFRFTAPHAIGASGLSLTASAADVFGELNMTQGCSMGLGNDETKVNPTGIVPAGPLLIDDPAFFEGGILPNGWTVGIVYSFVGDILIPFDGDTDLVTATYDFTGLAPMETTALTWSNMLGEPPVANVVVVDGGSVPAAFMDGSITFATDPSYIRGDCNDDGTVDIADGIWIINELFLEGAASGCAEACDSNSDGLYDASDAVYIWNYRFLDGMAPAAPFPACGETGDVPCAMFNSCP